MKQEPCAHLALIPEARLFESRSERQFGDRYGEADRATLRANLNERPRVAVRELEWLLLQAPHLRDTRNRALEHGARSPRRERRDRSCPLESSRPSKKWEKRKPADPPTAD